jgi:integrase
MSVLVLRGLCGLPYSKGQVQLAVSMLLGHHCLLRTGELVGLLRRDLVFDLQRRTVLVQLGYTKTGKRAGRREEILCDDGVLCEMLWTLCRSMSAEQPVCGETGPSFRKAFDKLCSSVEIGRHLKYFLYSLRRGGATALWEATRCKDHLMQRGRWANQRTAKQYVEESVMEKTLRELSRAEEKSLAKWATHLPQS